MLRCFVNNRAIITNCHKLSFHVIVLGNWQNKTIIEVILTNTTLSPSSQVFRFNGAMTDVYQGLLSWRIWLALGYQDIRLRYRRSQLGPLWITLSTAVMIYSMGFVYAKLFKIDLSLYYPYIATGLVVWAFISSLILEASDAFIENAAFIHQSSIPFSVYILRLLTRNFIIFFHNLLPVLPILIYYKICPSKLGLLELAFGLIILIIIGYSFGLLLAILGSRFRDMRPIVASLVQVFFLLTPILWQHSMLPQNLQKLTVFNPFYQLVELLRTPMLGQTLALSTIIFCLCLAGVGVILMLLILARSRHRIAFWM